MERIKIGGSRSSWVMPCVYLLSITASVAFISVLAVQRRGSAVDSPTSLKLTGGEGNYSDVTILDGRIEDNRREEEEVEKPIVRIRRQGRVQGTTLKSRQGRDYYAFYKVPYGQEPVSDLRFELAKSPRRWRGVRDGTTIGTECIQKDKYAPGNVTGGEEGCLHLNIYTPRLPTQRRRDKSNFPVLFYIHGGGSYGNGTRYGAKYFMDEDVILVTIEYRLGAFASFTTGTREYPGNFEHKDQIEGLKWVQRNIDRFGGDRKRVLIFGNSSGSMAVQAHLLSPMSQGLFSRGVMQSGTIIEKTSLIANPVQLSQTLAFEMGCFPSLPNSTIDKPIDKDVEKELVDCLRKVDAHTIALNPTNLQMAGMSVEAIPANGDLDEVFLPDTPWNLLFPPPEATPLSFNKVPLLIGVNSQEMMHGSIMPLMTVTGTEFLNDHWNEILPPIIGIPDNANHTMAQRFREVYFPDGGQIGNDTRVAYWDLNSDSIIHSSRISGLVYANRTGAPVFFYRLSKSPPKSYAEAVKSFFPPPYGVAHADELQYLFLYDGYPEITLESEWYEFSKKMVNIWATFAANGDPSTAYTDWPPIDPADNGMKWMDLNDELSLVEPFSERMNLWDLYIEQLYGPISPSN